MSSDVLAGEPFGKYVLVKRIAMGGMAEVILARLQGTAGFNKLVVIKQVLPSFAESPQFVEMFLDEGRLAAKLSHPNIAQTFELGEENGRHYLAMEYVPGESLYQVLKRCREKQLLLPLSCVLRVEMQLLEALEYAHGLHDDDGRSLHLVHRDITPSNVMVTHQGAIKLLDFGIARAATQVHRTEAGRVKGKGGYMAPEQCRSSKVDHRADVYGAGAVLYLMATGMKPFEHLPTGTDMMAQMNATMEGSFLRPHQVKKDINPELERIILRAMALKPDDRFQSAGDMLEELERFAGKAGVFPSPRELGDFVKKLFPPKTDDPLDPSREPSSSKATPKPENDERLATQDPSTDEPEAEPERASPSGRRRRPSGAGAVVAETDPMTKTVAEGLSAEPGTAPSLPAVQVGPKLPVPPKVIAIAAGGLAMLLLGVALAVGLKGGKPANEVPPPVPLTALAPKPVPPVPTPPPPPPAAVVEKEAAPPAPAEQPAVAAPADDEPRHATKGQAKKKKEKEREKEKDREERAAAPTPPAPTGKGGATGVLSINAYPWARVTYKGKELGVTPLKVTLPPGDYPIELENPGLNVKKTVKLSVKAGVETPWFEKFQ